MTPDFSRLPTVYDLACRAQVGFSLHFSEGENSWHFCITSPAPNEQWTSRDYQSLDIVIEMAIERLEGLVG